MDEVKENFSEEEKNIKGKKKQFYEFGAHFKYENLCDTLNKLKIRNLSGNEERKLSNNKRNTLDVKSRNIKLNNQMRSINLYLGNNKNKENKTSLLPKTDNIKHRINNHNEKINNKKTIKKEEKNNKKNIDRKNNKGNAKSSSQPKRITIQNISKNEFKKILDSNSNSLKISTLSNKKNNYYNIKTENHNLNKKDKLNNLKKRNFNSSSQSKNRKNQIKKTINNNLKLINDQSDFINNICLKPIDYLSLSKNVDKIKNESNSNSKIKNLTKEKLRPKSTQKMESKNIIKKKLLKIAKNKNELLDSKSKSRTLSSKEDKKCNSKKKLISKTKNNFNKYDKLSKNIFMNKSFKNKIKYSSINYINTSINKTNDHKMKTINQNATITIDNLSREKKNKKISKITKKNISRNNIYSDLNLTTSLNKNKILISPTSKIKKQNDVNKKRNKNPPDENSLILKKINNCEINNKNIKNKNISYHIGDYKKKNSKNKDNNKETNIFEKLKKEYKDKMNLIILKKGKVDIKK